MKRLSLLLSALALAAAVLRAIPERVVQIDGGKFTPLYGVESSDEQLTVETFWIDRFPVTNAEFSEFLRTDRTWSAETLPAILSDSGFLRHWTREEGSVAEPRSEDARKPVVRVSWFAASDYCVAKGGRLPSVLEWEYVGAASADKRDASRDPGFVQQLLEWYSKPSGGTDALRAVGEGSPNAWGVHDMHGLVWEWTADFNSIFVGGDNRREGEQVANMFCGAGAAGGTDKANYAAFMRYAFRNSLRGNYTTSNLGFRCAYDVAPLK